MRIVKAGTVDFMDNGDVSINGFTWDCEGKAMRPSDACRALANLLIKNAEAAEAEDGSNPELTESGVFDYDHEGGWTKKEPAQ